MPGISRNDACPIRLTEYEGPLDLLLYLIQREELDITRIALAQVTGQFLDFVRQMQAENAAGSLADYLVVAAQLMVIKSEALLPRPPAARAAEEESGEELVQQLIDYRRYKLAAAALQQRSEEGLRSFVRVVPPSRPTASGNGLDGVTLQGLHRLGSRALAIPPVLPPVSDVVTLHRLTIGGQIKLIEWKLTTGSPIGFHGLLTPAGGRVEVSVTLLAVLELIKRRRIIGRQERLFGPIWLELVA